MAKKTTLQEVKDKIERLKEEKEARIHDLQEAKNDAVARANDAGIRASEALRNGEVEEYHVANLDKNKANEEVKVYESALASFEIITEEESDKVLQRLEDYQNDIRADFESRMAKIDEEMKELFDSYTSEFVDTELTIRRWELEIHRNYISKTTTYQDGTNRSQVPIPFHPGYVNYGRFGFGEKCAAVKKYIER